ncbi:MAG: DegT/DnrJ/EryC1/StrS family aminotransferase [Deltaproteobacteria bacterium]|nr:DegT/DnrJ/EryC1/StrS family aminotransferase [Deltaproteobacteria bacterium]MBW2042585.1 DegT/DnrJ/EryC1/StrS family aminotransferase [Deltaproteobacteria bacterium]MBW2133233.1 DegT/DnrJ/EryC1/StrS family aminotransferase [Deltaproteobacteria bacterium]
MKVPLLDLTAQYEAIKDDVLQVLHEVCQEQRFILGPRVSALEAELARYCNTADAVGVSSGTDALLISLMAAEIGPGDLVATTPYTFFATAGVIHRTGAKPVFADIDPDTYNLSPARLARAVDRIPKADQRRLKAVLPVHLYGQCAEMDPILDIARGENLTVIEDAAQAIGAEYKGRRAGSMGDFGCFSFFPSKNLGAFGDGGCVTVPSAAEAHRLRVLRVHGSEPKYHHLLIGGNFRLDALQAAVVSIKLKHLDRWTEKRRENADRYRRYFASAKLDDRIGLPAEKQDRHIYNQFVIRVKEKRDGLKAFLAESGIGTEIYYPVPLHLQPCFSHLDYRKGDFPESEAAAQETLALPIFPELTDAQAAYVVEKIEAFFQNKL